MADRQIEEVKAKTDIVSLIGEYISLKKAGSNYKANCPFHTEKTPSFMVSPELQIYKCFGCGQAGDAFSFLQEYEAMEFYEALKFLADRAGVKLSPKKPGQISQKEELIKANTLAGQFYHYLLTKHKTGKAALEYLTKTRGLKPSTIEKFQLGYAPENPRVLADFLIGKKRMKKDVLGKAGLFYERNGRLFDRFRGRVVFPLHDHRGDTLGFAGRFLPGSSSKLAKYINSPETPIYQKSKLLYGLDITKATIKKKGEVVVVEGEFDMISPWQAGFKNIVAIKGSALTEDQARLLNRFCKRVLLALDADVAGDLAARRGVAVSEKSGLEVKVVQLKNLKDPDEAVRSDPKAFSTALKKAITAWDFIIESVFSKHDYQKGSGKAKISQEIIPILSQIEDSIVQAHYLGLVANKLRVPVESVASQLSKIKSAAERAAPELILSKELERMNRREILERRLMTLAFQSDPNTLLGKDTFSLIASTYGKKILSELKKFLRKNKGKFSATEFANQLPKELFDGFAEMILSGADQSSSGLVTVEKELEMVKGELELESFRESLKEAAEEIKIFETKGNKKKLKAAEEKFSKLTKKLSALEAED